MITCSDLTHATFFVLIIALLTLLSSALLREVCTDELPTIIGL